MSDSRAVLDAFALVAFFEDEPGAEAVEGWLIAAARGDAELLVSTVDLGEVWYSIARVYGEDLADAKLEEIHALPLAIVDADWALTRQAAEFKLRGGISYADCFAAAVAAANGATLLTGDPEFRRLEDAIEIEWLAAN